MTKLVKQFTPALAMKTVNIYEAKTRLSALVEEAISGEDVIIAKAGKALVRLVPVNKGGSKFRFGFLKGKLNLNSEIELKIMRHFLLAGQISEKLAQANVRGW